MGMAPVTVTPNNTLPTFLLSIAGILSSTGLEILVPKGRMLPPGVTQMAPGNWRWGVPPGHFDLLVSLNKLI